ncbi:MAG: hypothetical protein ACRCZ2_10145 [Fusobacteriaceae bacterium]
MGRSAGTCHVHVKFDYSDGRDTARARVPSLAFKEFEFPADLQERPRWRAEKYCLYYFVNATGEIERGLDHNWGSDNRRFEIGNYFETEDEAEESKFYKVFHEEV